MLGKISVMNDFALNSNEACFVRMVGAYEGYVADIHALDRSLSRSSAYIRLTAFEQISNRAEILRLQSETQDFAEAQPSYRKAMDVYRSSVPCVNSTIENNLSVTLMFWYEKYLKPLSKLSGENRRRLVCSGRIGYREYLLCYMAHCMGIDVLLLLPEGEPKISPVLLKLSQKSTVGENAHVDIPEFYPKIVQKKVQSPRNTPAAPSYVDSTHSDSNPVVKLPPHPKRVQKIVQSVGMQHAASVRTTQRTDTPQSYSQEIQSDGNIVIKLPPHPGRVQEKVQSVASANASSAQPVQRIVPAQSYSQVVKSDTNPKLIIPPHPRRTAQGSFGGVGVSRAVQGTSPSLAQQGAASSSSSAKTRQGSIPHAKPAQAKQKNIPPAKPLHALPPTNSRREELSYEQLATLAQSVVMIAVCDKNGELISGGSGIVISSKGYILTNLHVIHEGVVFMVRFENSDEVYYTSQVIKYHTNFDMAIIRIDKLMKPLPIYDGNKELVRGQKVVAIGSPMGLLNSVSDGIISGFRNVEGMDLIQFTAPTSKGSSGGALLNIFGEVIGVTTASIKHAQNMNLAVPYKQLLPFVRPFL